MRCPRQPGRSRRNSRQPAERAGGPSSQTSPESECHERGSNSTGGPSGPGRRGRLRDRDRRARQSRRRAALSRRGHRGSGGRRSLRAGVGPAGRRPLQTGAAPRRTAPADGALGRPARGRAGGLGDARPGVGLQPADRHLRRAGPREPRARLGDGALVRRPVRARRRAAAGSPGGDRPRRLDPRAFPDPLARRGQPRSREGDRRLLGLRRRARGQRLHLRRPHHRLHRRRCGCRAVGRGGSALRPAPRRGAFARAEDARGGRTHWATPSAG